ncbi:protoporphyrinogen oxidase [Nannizzia gypsea CBS 118893]|uniref:Protoporphyrinogen oxidase n=1 Tax=Arthroderma gypseum (strain ATCC MYA-4604 / CBS 118893) TaxID=535722 RepID=E4V709_ARTGP|nr:protoporphyrinogen oxidase [Nannizzia gypsea CBS 118893]EFQ96875.1 protoporphyrinogen oxidase [Nannizzia gypsea CBS 118893]
MATRRWPGLVSESCLCQPRTSILRRQCASKGVLPLSQWQWQRQQQQLRASSTAGQQGQGKQIAVVGGGITGLTTAFHLASQPKTQVTLYEKSNKLGGWMQSDIVDTGDGNVVFEHGPRTLQCGLYNAMATIELIIRLEMLELVLQTRADSPAYLNRYIYYPDHLVRVPMPRPGSSPLSVIWNLLQNGSEPAFKGLLRDLLGEPFRERRDLKIRDESIADFHLRKFGRATTDHFVSALMHGIYAGDIDKLSMKATMPMLWDLETGPHGIYVEVMDRQMSGDKLVLYNHNKLEVVRAIRREYSSEFNTRMSQLFGGASILSFKGGMRSLVSALSQRLEKLPNVEVVRDAAITHIQYDKPKGSMVISSAANKPQARYDYVISTTPSTVLADQLRGPGSCTPPTATSRMLAANDYAVSVMVVNLFYKNPNLIPMHGFGYLIPRSVPIEQNPERALGVMFATQAVRGQDSADGTKLAVMIGGHWWDGWNESDLPGQQEGIAMAKSVLARHLGITDEPVAAIAKLQYKAIPQYAVGHCDRMEDLHESLCREYDSRLKVAGAWYTGVGVNDGIAAGRAIATALCDGRTEETGLEVYVNPMQGVSAAIL